MFTCNHCLAKLNDETLKNCPYCGVTLNLKNKNDSFIKSNQNDYNLNDNLPPKSLDNSYQRLKRQQSDERLRGLSKKLAHQRSSNYRNPNLNLKNQSINLGSNYRALENNTQQSDPQSFNLLNEINNVINDQNKKFYSIDNLNNKDSSDNQDFKAQNASSEYFDNEENLSNENYEEENPSSQNTNSIFSSNSSKHQLGILNSEHIERCIKYPKLDLFDDVALTLYTFKNSQKLNLKFNLLILIFSPIIYLWFIFYLLLFKAINSLFIGNEQEWAKFLGRINKQRKHILGTPILKISMLLLVLSDLIIKGMFTLKILSIFFKSDKFLSVELFNELTTFTKDNLFILVIFIGIYLISFIFLRKSQLHLSNYLDNFYRDFLVALRCLKK
ncbi:MAG: hypothetical protein UHG91_00425 [Succinivibrionaceae bacterium]|nr:hypothetical protein [Succinivibrionaceae bacterium]